MVEGEPNRKKKYLGLETHVSSPIHPDKELTNEVHNGGHSLLGNFTGFETCVGSGRRWSQVQVQVGRS